MFNNDKKNNLKCFFLFLFFLISPLIWSGGEADASGSDMAEYLSAQGMVIPAEDIRISSYISQLDYNYPRPDKNLSVSLVSGNKFFPENGKPVIIQAGLQGAEFDFDDLPPFNLCFVIDTSGSMAENDKISLAKKSIAAAVSRLRPIDRISIISSTNSSIELFPSTLLKDLLTKQNVLSSIATLEAFGVSSMFTALKKAYAVCEKQYISNGVNRVILLSDGTFSDIDIEALVTRYKKKKINLTCAVYGYNSNSKQLVDFSISGGGSSRFISNEEQIDEHFYTDLDRMLVPIATELKFTIKLKHPYKSMETWGYNYEIQDETISYYLPTLHHRDYETVLTEVFFNIPDKEKEHTVAEFSLSYNDMYGKKVRESKKKVTLRYQRNVSWFEEAADPFVLKSMLMLSFARNLISIAEVYENAQALELQNQNTRYSSQILGIKQPSFIAELKDHEQRESAVRNQYEQAVDLVLLSWKAVSDAEMRLGEELFSAEKNILINYLNIFNRKLYYSIDKMTLFKSGQFTREKQRPKNIGSAGFFIVKELLTDVKKNSQILFPEIPYGPQQLGDLDSVILTALMKAGMNIKGILPGTDPDQYLEHKFAAFAGKLQDCDYVILLKFVSYPEQNILYGVLLDSETGSVLRTAQMIVY